MSSLVAIRKTGFHKTHNVAHTTYVVSNTCVGQTNENNPKVS